MSFSCIKINGNSYHVKDSTARTDIATLKTRVTNLENNAGSGSGSSGYTSTKISSGFRGINQTQTLSQSWRNFDALMFCEYIEDDDTQCVAIEVPRSVLEGLLLAEIAWDDGACVLWLFDQNIANVRHFLKVSNLTETTWKVLQFSDSNFDIYGIKY